MPMTMILLICLLIVKRGLLENFIELMDTCFEKTGCVPQSSKHKLLVHKTHGGGLMGHFGVKKTLEVSHEHFFWPRMKHDVERICGRCVT